MDYSFDQMARDLRDIKDYCNQLDQKFENLLAKDKPAEQRLVTVSEFRKIFPVSLATLHRYLKNELRDCVVQAGKGKRIRVDVQAALAVLKGME